jgi:hypothetical protein
LKHATIHAEIQIMPNQNRTAAHNMHQSVKAAAACSALVVSLLAVFIDHAPIACCSLSVEVTTSL